MILSKPVMATWPCPFLYVIFSQGKVYIGFQIIIIIFCCIWWLIYIICRVKFIAHYVFECFQIAFVLRYGMNEYDVRNDVPRMQLTWSYQDRIAPRCCENYKEKTEYHLFYSACYHPAPRNEVVQTVKWLRTEASISISTSLRKATDSDGTSHERCYGQRVFNIACQKVSSTRNTWTLRCLEIRNID